VTEQPGLALRAKEERGDWPMEHGLYYVNRTGQTIYLLDRLNFPTVPRPERDVLLALLDYAQDRLVQQTHDEDER
jgi:hypothetical protein